MILVFEKNSAMKKKINLQCKMHCIKSVTDWPIGHIVGSGNYHYGRQPEQFSTTNQRKLF